MTRILAADIGGTHSRFALFEAAPDNQRRPLLTLLGEQWLKGADYADFSGALAALVSDKAGRGSAPAEVAHLFRTARPAIAVIAPAGPIEGEQCRISNLPWVVRADDVRRVFGISRVALLNDFAAQAYACLLPDAVDAATVIAGEAVPQSPVAIMGAGTGFGQALLLCAPPAGAGWEPRNAFMNRLLQAKVLPSEGGHAEVPFVNERECAFAAFTQERAGTARLIGDAIVSGSGLVHLFAFLTGKELSAREAAGTAADNPEVLEWFARFYGRLCRNYVLHTMALGGLYITGGMAMRVPVLGHPAFAEEFCASVAQGRLLRKVPVMHVCNPQAGLWGAGLYGLLRLLSDPAAGAGAP